MCRRKQYYEIYWTALYKARAANETENPPRTATLATPKAISPNNHHHLRRTCLPTAGPITTPCCVKGQSKFSERIIVDKGQGGSSSGSLLTGSSPSSLPSFCTAKCAISMCCQIDPQVWRVRLLSHVTHLISPILWPPGKSRPSLSEVPEHEQWQHVLEPFDTIYVPTRSNPPTSERDERPTEPQVELDTEAVPERSSRQR